MKSIKLFFLMWFILISCNGNNEKSLNNKFSGPAFILLKVSKSNPPKYSRNWNASEEKSKFRKNLIN